MQNSSTASALLVIGLGLLGGSVLRAARAAGAYDRYLGYDAATAVTVEAHRLGICDNATGDLGTLAQQAELIVVAVPVLAVAEVFQCLHQAAALDRYITDVASVKDSVIGAVQSVAAGVPATFVPAHPIAGSEQSGVQAARATLFQAHKVILTPLDCTDSQALAYVSDFWTALGAQVVQMHAATHDRILATTSHLPHVLAYAMVNTLRAQPDADCVFEFAAGGFRDFSRIASSDPTMWRDILLANRTAILDAIEQFAHELQHTRELIERADGSALFELLSEAKTARDACVVLPGSEI